MSESLRRALESIHAAASRGTVSSVNECAYCPTIKAEAEHALRRLGKDTVGR